MAPVVSHVAVSRTTSAGAPTRSWSRVNFDQPLRTLAAPNDQPSGTSRTHGTKEAVGTDWASSHRGSSSWQDRLAMDSGVVPASLLISASRKPSSDQDRQRDHQEQQPHPPQAPPLDRDRTGPSRQQVQELVVQVAALLADHPAQLRRDGEPACSCEGLLELGRAELADGSAVDPCRIRAQRQAEHHVRQVDGLAPRAGASLGEGHIDQQQTAVPDEQVGGLDVPMGQTGVPQVPDQHQPVVDDLVVDDGVAELCGVCEELGDQQVLPFGVSSTKP